MNTSLGESRPSLSWDAEQLLFGRAGPAGTGEGGTGASDIYVATREKATGTRQLSSARRRRRVCAPAGAS